MKVWQKLILVVTMIAVLIFSMYYDAFHTAPSRYSVRYETLTSVFIPSQMDDVSILFFSDLDFGHFMNEERLNKLTQTINNLSPDIIIFGGDLFDQQHDIIDDHMKSEVASYFASMKAPLGKFAVLGDFDHESDETLQAVKDILYSSDFELLDNTSILLRNNGSQSITLVGLDSGLNGSQDINSAYANVSSTSYVITVCHTPDSCENVPAELTKYFLAGHSHGGQAYWGFGALYTPDMAKDYFRGIHTIKNTFTLDITNGTGTTKEDVRFLANAEVVLYRLKHKDTSQLTME